MVPFRILSWTCRSVSKSLTNLSRSRSFFCSTTFDFSCNDDLQTRRIITAKYCFQWQPSLIIHRSSSNLATKKQRPGGKSKRTNKIHQFKRRIKDHSDGRQMEKGVTKNINGPYSAFISCLPGLEPFLLQEVQYLLTATQSSQHPVVAKATAGGVKVVVPQLAHLYVLHLYLGTASHIYLRLNDSEVAKSTGIPPLFRARCFPELQRKLRDLMVTQRWDVLLNVPHFGVGKTISESSLPWKLQVHVTSSKSKLIHTKAVNERVRQTIRETLGLKESESDANIVMTKTVQSKTDARPTVRLFVRIDRDLVQFSLDTSASDTATPLHMRGYRLNPHKAPLREDLAFALLMAGGVNPQWNLQPLQSCFGTVIPDNDTSASGTELRNEISPEGGTLKLFDPLCGSGTIAIEGASILAGLPPGRFRQPPFWGTNLSDIRLWDAMKSKALTAHDVKNKNTLFVAANDISKEAINAAISNSKRAGVDQFIDFSVGSFKIHPLIKQTGQSTFNISHSHLLRVVANPPFGKRLSTDETQSSIYKQIAKALKSLPYKIQCTMIGNDVRGVRESSLPMKVAFSTKHGGMNVAAMTCIINN